MLINTLGELIQKARKEGAKERVVMLGVIKTELETFAKKQNPQRDLTKKEEDNILLKIVANLEESLASYEKNGKKELAEKTAVELSIVNEFAPKIASDEDVANLTRKIISEKYPNVSMKDMKNILTEVNETYPTAKGGIVSKIVKDFMNA
jgi:uncharacterized protein YqeY